MFKCEREATLILTVKWIVILIAAITANGLIARRSEEVIDLVKRFGAF